MGPLSLFFSLERKNGISTYMYQLNKLWYDEHVLKLLPCIATTNSKHFVLLFSVDQLEKYDGKINPSFSCCALNILQGFYVTPPLTNSVGRDAAYNVLRICQDLVCELDRKKYNTFSVRNVGGGALGYPGSCTFRQ